jgi:hypothetical protein
MRYRNYVCIDFDKLTNSDWDWLVGLYFADGSKVKEKQRQYRVYFYLSPKKDTFTLKKLLKIFKTLELKPMVKIQQSIRTLIVRITSKELFAKIPAKKESQTYFPKNIDSFIAGFLDGDGYIIKKRGRVGFSQTIVKWIGPFISSYLKEIGIKPWRETYYRNCFYYETSFKKIKEKTDIIRFMASAGEHNARFIPIKV